jgi:hypothetical protein
MRKLAAMMGVVSILMGMPKAPLISRRGNK